DLLQQKRAHRFADFDILLLPQTLREEADIALRPLPPRLPQKSIGAFMHPEQEVAREDWIRVTQADSVDARRVRLGGDRDLGAQPGSPTIQRSAAPAHTTGLAGM